MTVKTKDDEENYYKKRLSLCYFLGVQKIITQYEKYQREGLQRKRQILRTKTKWRIKKIDIKKILKMISSVLFFNLKLGRYKKCK